MNRRLVIGGVAVLLLAALLVAVPLLPGKGTGELSAYESGPFGLQDARIMLAREGGFVTRNVASSPLIVRDIDANSTLLVVSGLRQPYTPSEGDALDAFLRDGGALLILDDKGYGQEYTKRHGIEFLHRPLLDQQFDRNQSFVRVSADLGAATPFGLLLNSPTALRDVTGNDSAIHPFMVSSADSFLDLDEDGTIDVADKVGPFNVGLRRQVGAGTLYVIADSGFIVNDMLGRDDNKPFLLALADDELPDDGLVLFDESKRTVEASEAPILATQRATLAIYRNIPQLGLLVLASLAYLAMLALVRLPGRESWVHRHRPGQYVPPPQPRTKLDLVTSILQAKHSIDQASGVQDPMLEQALRDPDALRPDDLHRLLEHVRSAMDLELPPGETTDDPNPQVT